MKDLSIIIVSWNTKQLLLQTIKSIYDQTKDASFEIIVVDNASSDGSVEAVARAYPDVIIIANNQNTGFAKANNQGISISSGRYICALNPDTEIRSNALDKMMHYMDNQLSPIMASCTLLNPDGSYQLSVRRDPTVVAAVLIMLKLHNFFPKWKYLKEYFCLDFDYESEQEVEQIMGAFMMWPRTLLAHGIRFDTDYPLLFEDVDLCKRVRSEGYKVIYTPTAQIMHHKGQSFAQEMKMKNQKRFNRGLRIYFKKHGSALGGFLVSLLYLPSLALAYIAGMMPEHLKRKDL